MARPIAPKIQKITPRTTKMTPIVQRMGLLQKRAATIRQMMPRVIKCASDARDSSAATLSVAGGKYPALDSEGETHRHPAIPLTGGAA